MQWRCACSASHRSPATSPPRRAAVHCLHEAPARPPRRARSATKRCACRRPRSAWRRATRRPGTTAVSRSARRARHRRRKRSRGCSPEGALSGTARHRRARCALGLLSSAGMRIAIAIEARGGRFWGETRTPVPSYNLADAGHHTKRRLGNATTKGSGLRCYALNVFDARSPYIADCKDR